MAILFGVYVRFFAILLIVMTLLGAWLFGAAILAYAGALIGAGKVVPIRPSDKTADNNFFFMSVSLEMLLGCAQELS